MHSVLSSARIPRDRSVRNITIRLVLKIIDVHRVPYPGGWLLHYQPAVAGPVSIEAIDPYSKNGASPSAGLIDSDVFVIDRI